MTDSVDHLHFFLKKIETGEPFGLIRPNDGEYMILQGMENFQVQESDGWRSHGPEIRNDLHNALLKASTQDTMYIGTCCPGCNPEICKYMSTTYRIRTYGNIVCNRNHRILLHHLKTKKFYYIGPGTQPCDSVIDRLVIDPLLINNWDTEKGEFMRKSIEWVEKSNDSKLFLISAGPLAKILIPELVERYPTKQFMDAGSALDNWCKGVITRPFMEPRTMYYNQVCSFTTGHAPREYAITCVLNFYKRPYTIHEQLNAIRNQTIQPKKIIIWVNETEGVKFPDDIKSDSSLTIVRSSENFGVWPRFAISQFAETPYVCVFDDDTIPGRKWLQNCCETMDTVNGLLGTIGVVFNNADHYSMKCRHGWDAPSTEIHEVDTVGHSWFFKREWLQCLWQFHTDPVKLLRCGEDMSFTCGLQRVGIKTYVPPHPPHDLEMFGSHPEKAWSYGTDKNAAISMQQYAMPIFSEAFMNLRKNHGFKILADNVV
jgi:hypothetical protein